MSGDAEALKKYVHVALASEPRQTLVLIQLLCRAHTSSQRRCGATAQSALGWYRPSVGVPETFGGYLVVVVYFV